MTRVWLLLCVQCCEQYLFFASISSPASLPCHLIPPLLFSFPPSPLSFSTSTSISISHNATSTSISSSLHFPPLTLLASPQVTPKWSVCCWISQVRETIINIYIFTPFIHLSHHMYTYVHPLYMYIHHISPLTHTSKHPVCTPLKGTGRPTLLSPAPLPLVGTASARSRSRAVQRGYRRGRW